MAESSEQVALVHSLVTLSVSDQWTRARVQNDAPTQQASDNKLIVLLTAITSVEGSLFDLVTKLNVLSSERHAVQYPSSMQFHDFPGGRHYRRHYSGGGSHAPHHRGFGFNF
ncbi:hypothetical protein DdX_14392 [Ditylenchus destructor]|uniref:Uncharacterized protein n=1 Tax=Ditylenchus destructor TaxID=166010 RepID=A0AAD4MWZ0_9BILA|nr:hypothetical protein DdX_14392 [Ditylenchus destructor]